MVIMNLDDLRYFLAIADTGLLHRAAEQVGVSQPALTKAVRRLEAELGVALFERSPKGMLLTRFGTEFQRHAASLRTAYEDALNQLGEMSAGELAKVRLGATPAAEPLVDRAFLALVRNRPALRLDLTVQLSDTLIRGLLDGEIDLAVGPLPAELPEALRAIPLLTESTFVVCRAGHPLCSTTGSVSPSQLGSYPWILPGHGVSARQQIDAYFRKHRVEGPRVQVQSSYSSPVGVFFLVANTDMLGICSTQHRPVAEQLGLKTLVASQATWSRQIAILTRKSGSLSPLTQTFLQLIVEEATFSA